jgi:integrase
MKEFIGNNLIAKLKPRAKAYDVWDTKLTGFILRVLPSGSMVYRCEYARGKRITLGKANLLTPAQARDEARRILSEAVIGVLPSHSKHARDLTLEKFFVSEYEPWRKANRKNGKDDLRRLKVNFVDSFGKLLLTDITPVLIERWRTKRINDGIKATTVNRDIIILKAALTKAVEWEIILQHPLQKLKLLKVDATGKICYLHIDEEKRLKNVLQLRDEQMKSARSRGNAWRSERDYTYLPNLTPFSFADHPTPMVLISLNTGLRRGELFSLRWENINLEQGTLTVTGDNAKSGKTRHVPLNAIALKAFKEWSNQAQESEWVFMNNKTGNAFTHTKRAWTSILEKAQITNFRWHDMRHHFASKLVMAGVDLNTVRELLGHADIKMTLRYAHLAPEHKAKAVEKLVTSY